MRILPIVTKHALMLQQIPIKQTQMPVQHAQKHPEQDVAQALQILHLKNNLHIGKIHFEQSPQKILSQPPHITSQPLHNTLQHLSLKQRLKHVHRHPHALKHWHLQRQLKTSIHGPHKLNLHPQQLKLKQSHQDSFSNILSFLDLAM